MINIVQFAGTYHKNPNWTQVFEKAVDQLDSMGGGTIYVPSGIYFTRSIKLKSNMNLYLEAGAVLEFLDDYENYKVVTTQFQGNLEKMYMPLIFADHAENVAVTGYGTINGNGRRWWKEKEKLEYNRPYLMCFQYCNRVKIENVSLKNSPVWTIHPLYCNDVIIDGVSIQNPYDSPNTDGINPDSSSNVRIANCSIDVGDDCITIKSGTEITPEKEICENISITNCNMHHGHGAIVMGSEMSGGIRNVTVSNCTFQNTDRGIRIKTRRKRGGVIENLTFQNIVMNGVQCPFTFNMYYNDITREEDKALWDKNPYPVDASTPVIKNIMIGNVFVNDATVAAGFLYGLAEQPIQNVIFTNCSIRMSREGEPGMPAMLGDVEPVKAGGFFLRNAKDIVFNNVMICNTIGEPIDEDDLVELRLCECYTSD